MDEIKLRDAGSVNDPPDNCVLKKTFDRCAAITITDEQVRRMLEPILRMIREGRFDRPSVFSRWLQAVVVAAAAVAAVALIVAFVRCDNMRESFMADVPNITISTVGAASYERGYEMFASVVLQGRNTRDAKFVVYDESGAAIIGAAVMKEDGSYRFSVIPDGDYRLVAILPAYPESERNVDIGRLIVTGGRYRLIDN